MAFEVFQATGAKNKPFISVTENSTFGLSRAFIDKHDIKKNHKAVVLYDADTSKVALYFSTNNPPFGYAVQIGNEKHGAIIAARGFFEMKAIDVRKYSRRYSDYEKLRLRDLGVDQEGYAYVIQLKEKTDNPKPSPEESQNEIVTEETQTPAPQAGDVPF